MTKEKNITPQVIKWFSRVVPHSCPFEIKHTRGKSLFTLNELAQHQRDYLLAATTDHGVTWKIPDVNAGYNPFDCFHFKNSEAYVIIVYSFFTVAIRIQDILKVETPSLHSKDAMELSQFTIKTKEL